MVVAELYKPQDQIETLLSIPDKTNLIADNKINYKLKLKDSLATSNNVGFKIRMLDLDGEIILMFCKKENNLRNFKILNFLIKSFKIILTAF